MKRKSIGRITIQELKRENKMKIVEKDIHGEPLTASYEDYLIESLKDPREARAYLNAALEDEDKDYRVFLLALRNIADAFGMTEIAKKAGLNRENIYRMLSKKGNPTISSLFPLLHAIGVRLNIELAKAELKEEHYKIEVEQFKPRNVIPNYATKLVFPSIPDFPKLSRISYSQPIDCEYEMAA